MTDLSKNMKTYQYRVEYRDWAFFEIEAESEEGAATRLSELEKMIGCNPDESERRKYLTEFEGYMDWDNAELVSVDDVHVPNSITIFGEA